MRCPNAGGHRTVRAEQWGPFLAGAKESCGGRGAPRAFFGRFGRSRISWRGRPSVVSRAQMRAGTVRAARGGGGHFWPAPRKVVGRNRDFRPKTRLCTTRTFLDAPSFLRGVAGTWRTTLRGQGRRGVEIPRVQKKIFFGSTYAYTKILDFSEKKFWHVQESPPRLPATARPACARARAPKEISEKFPKKFSHFHLNFSSHGQWCVSEPPACWGLPASPTPRSSSEQLGELWPACCYMYIYRGHTASPLCTLRPLK